MSIENLNKFLQLLVENEEAARKVKEIGVENRDAIVAYAGKLGYEFNRQELEELENRVAELYKARIKKNLEKFAATEKEQRTGTQNLNKFVQLVGENADIANKVQEIGFNDPGAIIAYARELGFEFDERDLEEFGSRMLEQTDELSEEELDRVAGGVIPGIALAASAGIAVGLVAGTVASIVVWSAIGGAAVAAVGKHV